MNQYGEKNINQYDKEIINQIINESESILNIQKLNTYFNDKAYSENDSFDNQSFSTEDDSYIRENSFDRESSFNNFTEEDIKELISSDVIQFYKNESFKNAESLLKIIHDLYELKSKKLYNAIKLLVENYPNMFHNLDDRIQTIYNERNVPEYNILLSTHNGRLRCFLVDLLKTTLDNLLTKSNKHFNKKFTQIRFKNACILKLILYDDKCTFELVYSGDVTNRKRGYYFKSENDTSNLKNNEDSIDIVFPKVTIDIKDQFKNYNSKIRYNIFILRHGEAAHNIRKINLEPDTNLSEDGILSVENTGEYLNKLSLNFDYIFSSPLYRAIQTTDIILKMTNVKNNKNIVILKCSNELPFCKTGHCDGKKINIAPENISMCAINNNTKKCSNINGYNISWDWYKSLDIDCSETNFVNLLLSYIENKK